LVGPGEATEAKPMDQVNLTLSLVEIVVSVIDWVKSRSDTFVFYPCEKGGSEKPLIVQMFRSKEYEFQEVYLFNGELIVKDKGKTIVAKVPKEWLEFEGVFRLLGRRGWKKTELLKRLEKFKT
jgi:hypothetical protein